MDVDQALQEIATTYQRIKTAEAAARAGYEHYLDEVQQTYATRRQALETAYQQQQRQVETTYQTAIDATDTAFAQAGTQLQDEMTGLRSAFRWIVAPWEDPIWTRYEPIVEAPVPSAVRVGRLAGPEGTELGDVPALAGLIGAGHLFVTGPDPTTTRHLLQTILLRLVVTFPPGTLRLILVDPATGGTTLAPFLRLPETLRGAKIYTRPDEIAHQLDGQVTHIETVIQTRLLNRYPTLEAYNAQAGEIAVPYHILALSDLAMGFSEPMVERLLHIARNGPRAGVYILAGLNPAHPFPRRSGQPW